MGYEAGVPFLNPLKRLLKQGKVPGSRLSIPEQGTCELEDKFSWNETACASRSQKNLLRHFLRSSDSLSSAFKSSGGT